MGLVETMNLSVKPSSCSHVLVIEDTHAVFLAVKPTKQG